MPVAKMTVNARSKLSLFLLLALAVYGIDALLIRTVPLSSEPAPDRLLIAAVFFDFVIVVPLLYYWLVARGRTPRRSIRSALPFMAIGGLAAWAVLPASLGKSILLAEALLLPIEAVFVIVELRLAIAVYRKVRTLAAEGIAFPHALKEALGPGRLAAYIRHDILVLYYLFGSWRTKRVSAHPANKESEALSESHFTYHRETSLFIMAGLLTKLLVLEGVVIHLLVRQWSELAAWVLTLGSVWLIALMWADCRRSILEPTRLTTDAVAIRCGLRLQGDIPYANIADVETRMELGPDKKEAKLAAVVPLSTPNVRLTLRRPSTVEGLLFQPRQVTSIYLALDDPNAFVRSLRNRLAASE